MISSKERFHASFAGIKLDKTPVWFMRQAGRFLPEYRALKEKYSFKELVQTPELACEVTLQPLQRFAGIDCGIIFSDILVICEALGVNYHFKEEGGIALDKKIASIEDVELLDEKNIREKLSYVAKALRLVSKEVPNKALLGFGGSAFTLASYMIEGGSSKDFANFKNFINEKKDVYLALATKINKALKEYFQMQIEAGVDAIQIFDSNAGIVNADLYEELSCPFSKELVSSLEKRTRTIFYAKAASDKLKSLVSIDADCLSLDSCIDLEKVRNTFKNNFALQGNLDQELLTKENAQDEIVKKTKEILTKMKDHKHIFNTGHGFLPSTKIENVELVLDTINKFSI